MTTKIDIENVKASVRTRDELVRLIVGKKAGVRLSLGIEPDAARELAGQLLTCADAVDAGEDVEPCEDCGELLFGDTLRRDAEGIPFCQPHAARIAAEESASSDAEADEPAVNA